MLKNNKIEIKLTKADISVCDDAASFLQSSIWGEFKSRFGWTACAFSAELSCENINEKFSLLALSHRLSPGFSLVYVPWGPELSASFPALQRETAMAQLAKKLKPFFSRNTMFIRFDPPWQKTDNTETDKLFLSAGFIKAAASVQPPDTVIINLIDSCGEILSQMKPKWRYNISLAGKKGVKVKAGGAENIGLFYNLMKETAQRDGIAMRGINYYETLFEMYNKENGSAQPRGEIRLYTASHEDDTLAAIVVLFRGKDAVYLYGASSNNKRNLMAPYALQWKAMQDAKEMECENYDLYGIPPNEDPSHPMAGLYRFKTGFGGSIIHRAGTWDYPYKKIIYPLFNILEKLRKRIMNLRKKR